LVSTFSNNDEIAYLHLYFDPTGTGDSAYVEETNAERYTHTSTALAVEVCLVEYPLQVEYVSSVMKITGDFSAASDIPATQWKAGKSNITIKKLNKII
jgi:hypothetical protein